MGICGDFGVGIGLTQEVELSFHVWNELAPKVEWKFVGCAAEDSNEMVFPCLYGLFGNVAAMVIRWH